jgi:hypothetical protein
MQRYRIRVSIGALALALLAGCASQPRNSATVPGELDADATLSPDAAARPSGLDGAGARDQGPADLAAIEGPVDTGPGDDAASTDSGKPDAAPGMASIGWDRAVDGRPAFGGPSVKVAVSVNRAARAGRVGPGFLGFSFEKSHLTDGFFSPANAPLVALFRLLGPGVLRIGANDVDRTTWEPAAQPVMGGSIARVVGTAAVDALAAFVHATGWRVIYGVNLKTGTPANSAAEAKYAADKLGPALYGLELGNEINLGGVAYADRKVQWEALAAAVRAAVPGAPLIGPATNPGGLGGFLVPFVKDEASKLRLVTHHYYRGSGTSPTSTMEKLLSADPGLVRALQTLAASAGESHIPDGFRVAETASFSSHGAGGVSDAFGAALWALDFFFDNAGNGSSGINFHGGGQGEDGNRPFYYAPIGEQKSAVTDARPVYYGMLAMSQVGQGDVIAATATAGALNFTAHALLQADGTLMLVLVNKDPMTAADVTVDAGAPAASAAAAYLQAAALGATSGVTLSGAGVSAAGAWTPAPPFRISAAGREVMLLVPPASAAIVRVR